MCFQIDGKSSQAAKCAKSRIMTEVIYFVFYINIFEKHFILKGVFQSPRLKDHMKTIGIDQ